MDLIISGSRKLLKKREYLAIAQRILAHFKLAHFHFSLSLLITGDQEITEYNLATRGLPQTTDVLSYTYIEDFTTLNPAIPHLLGAIIINKDQVMRQNPDYLRETKELFAHAVLHLLGFDHQTKETEAAMFALQRSFVD